MEKKKCAQCKPMFLYNSFWCDNPKCNYYNGEQTAKPTCTKQNNSSVVTINGQDYCYNYKIRFK